MGFDFKKLKDDVSNLANATVAKANEVASTVKSEVVALKDKTPEQIGRGLGEKTGKGLDSVVKALDNGVAKIEDTIEANKTKTLGEIGENISTSAKDVISSLNGKLDSVRERYQTNKENKM